MKFLKGFQKTYDRCEEILIVTMLAVSVVIIFYQVVMRYLFNNSPAWTEELAKILFVWMSWFGISLTQKRGDHICIELLTSKLRGTAQAATLIIGDVITIIICAVLVKYGYAVAEVVMRTHQTSGVLKFPMWIVFASCPVSCGLMILRLLGHIKRQWGVMVGCREKTAEE